MQVFERVCFEGVKKGIVNRVLDGVGGNDCGDNTRWSTYTGLSIRSSKDGQRGRGQRK